MSALPDIAQTIALGATNPWVYLPVAVLLGALHALEPGHSKSVMAAFIISIKGTAGQAVLLGLSAAIGHTIIVWGLVLAGLALGENLVLSSIEPWLIFISGLLILLLGARLLRGNLFNAHHHRHNHDHHHEHGACCGHHHATPEEIKKQYKNHHVTAWDITWFGFSGGLMPCPSALAVLLICLQLQKFTLGVAMVSAFSAGLAISLIGVGVVAAWGTHHARKKLSGKYPALEVWAEHLPAISGALVCLIGVVITVRGMLSLGWISY